MKKKRSIIVEIPETNIQNKLSIQIAKELKCTTNDVTERCFEFLNQAEISYFLKDQIYSVIQNEKRIPVMIAQLISMGLDEKLLAVLMEIISAYNIEERT